MSHHDKFWEKFGRKIQQHQPEGYTDGEWKDMEQLLNGVTQPSRRINRTLLSMVLLAAVVGYLAGAWYGWPSVPKELGAFSIPMPGIVRVETPAPGTTPEENTSEVLTAHSDAGTPSMQRQSTSESEVPFIPSPEVRSSSSVFHNSTLAATPLAQNSLGSSVSERLPETNADHAASSRNPVALLSRLPTLSGDLAQQQTTGQPIAFNALFKKKQSRFFGGFLLGGNLSAIGRQNPSFSSYPFGGLFAGFQIGRRWAIQAEAQVKYVDNVPVAYEQTERLESNNGFFFDQSSRGVAEKNYLALEIPLVVKYKLRPAWNFVAGLSPSLIRETVVSNTRQDGQAVVNPTTNAGQNRENTGSAPRLRQFDLGVSAGLEWSFQRRWSIDARFTRGFLDLSPDRVFQENVQHLNTSFQLSARFKF